MRLRNSTTVVAACLLVTCSIAAAPAEVRLPAVIGDNMVLQQGQPVPVWGWADPGEMIAVTIAGQSVTAKAGPQGRWQVRVKELKPGEPLQMAVNGSSGSKVTVKNILVGEVWVCSGQSNMAWPVSRADNPEQEIAAAGYPKIRLFSVLNKTAHTPQIDCGGQWVECNPVAVPGFSAVAYFFGRHLHKELGVPIGLVQTAWGGTPAEAWTSRKALEARPSLKPLLEQWDRRIADFDAAAAGASYRTQLQKWEQAAKKAKQEGRRPPRKPRAPGNPADSPHRPANLYNGMIAPLIPYAMRGAIWYQGESNVSRAYEYRTIFPTMIENWRADWAASEFPFGFVQLAPFRYGQQDPANCAELWEAQLRTLENVPNTGMAVTMDIGNVGNIHPGNKQDVGYRLGLWALATVYEKDLVYSGPIYKSMKVEGQRIRLEFDHTGGGLAARGGKPLSHFTIAGADRQFHPATAEIDGGTLVVHSDRVKQPIAVRYAWRDDAVPNLANKEGLPASPFRTDDFPCVTKPQP